MIVSSKVVLAGASHHFMVVVVAVVLVFLTSFPISHGFQASGGHSFQQRRSSSSRTTSFLQLSSSSSSSKDWSVTDDWKLLSSESKSADSRKLFNQDIVAAAANEMEQQQNHGGVATASIFSKEDVWLEDTIHDIHNQKEEDEESKEDMKELHEERFMEDMGTEIAMLVRCNESPETLLIQEGRAVKSLTDKDLNNVAQLVEYINDNNNNNNNNDNNNKRWQATPFLQQAVQAMFEKHCNDNQVLDAHGIASWMQTSLQQKQQGGGGGADHNVEGIIGIHDKRITQTLAKYGTTYGAAHLTLSNFVQLYVSAIVGDDHDNNNNHDFITTPERLQQYRSQEIQNVWRDIRNHNIMSPIELDYKIQVAQLLERQQQQQQDQDDLMIIDNDEHMILDECEILDDYTSTSLTSDRQGKSSHESVQLITNTKTPIWINDGEFVFIDEETCIGCMQCASAAPASFQMLENGRARTFAQRPAGPDVQAAVKTCPVDCMHFVSYDELVELEQARDIGVEDDHKHFGHTTTRGYIIPRVPLHVSRRDSDANHKESFYHYIRNKCFKSSNCPSRGCFDCPRHKDDPEHNPNFMAKQQKAQHLRAQYFMETGMADSYRKTADL